MTRTELTSNISAYMCNDMTTTGNMGRFFKWTNDNISWKCQLCNAPPTTLLTSCYNLLQLSWCIFLKRVVHRIVGVKLQDDFIALRGIN